jgi:outer membrane protein
MKNLAIILSATSLLLVAALFFLFFNHTEQIRKISEAAEKQSTSHFRIAYFETDSLEANYYYFKDLLDQAREKQDAMNSELNSMEKEYQKKIAEWQKKGSTMTASESEKVQQEYAGMQQNYQTRKQALSEELYKYNEDLKSDVRKKIEDYLKNYNKQMNYSFIFASEPSSFMYCKDTLYNITQDLVNGLNAGYKNKKKN